ncbi:hypothetical protein Adu01nite_68730 [Paractinoplanes durhamensis]|uniref:Uncharacterized protein n=1 Tax=Paractinoplanes durhamensis TaxID=113563 RepID=A0ABQ3Z6R4_9ACTN|nr:hypothetical protein Adu01nite_68730 [Actinoplanes durhamensis]
MVRPSRAAAGPSDGFRYRLRQHPRRAGHLRLRTSCSRIPIPHRSDTAAASMRTHSKAFTRRLAAKGEKRTRNRAAILQSDVIQTDGAYPYTDRANHAGAC